MTETEHKPDPESLPPLPGAGDLRRHIVACDQSIPEWCEAHGLERISIQKLLNGDLQRVSVELAFDIEQATNGTIEARLWVPDTDVREMQRERRKAAARARARSMRERRADGGSDGGH